MRAGATELQIDEPYYSGFPEDLPWAVKAINALVDGVDAPRHAAHLLRQPLRQAVVRGQLPVSVPDDPRRASVHALSLEFARRGEEDLQLFKEFKAPFTLGSRRHRREDPGHRVAGARRGPHPPRARSRPGRALVVNPDCGCVHLPRDVAFAKLVGDGRRHASAE